MGLPSFWTDFWDPIWAVAEEADLPVCMHVGSSGYTPIQSGDSNFLEPIAIGMIGALMGSINLMLAPPAYKFPKLKLVWSEGGIGWIPAALERADRQFERHNYWAKAGDIKPSEIFQRNMWVCMIEEPVGLSVPGARRGGQDPLGVRLPARRHAVAAGAEGGARSCSPGCPTTRSRRSRTATPSGCSTGRWPTRRWRRLRTSPRGARRWRTIRTPRWTAGTTSRAWSTPARCRLTPVIPAGTRVQDNNMFRACGQPIDADGTCAAGHTTVLATA